MDRTDELLRELYDAREVGYGKDLPGRIDETYMELARIYADSDCAGRRVIREKVSDDVRLLLLGFGDRLAIVADRRKDEGVLWLSFLAHSIEDFRRDARENQLRLALLNHVAAKLGLNQSAVFDRAAEVSSDHAARLFRAFDSRAPVLKSLKAMRIVEEMTDAGVSYRYT